VHIMLDGRGCHHLDDPRAIEVFIEQCAQLCQMEILSGPVTAAVIGEGIEDGWSGQAIIKQSGIQVHTFPEARFIYIDVFTCGPDIESQVIADCAQTMFGLQEHHVKVLDRGKQHRLQVGLGG